MPSRSSPLDESQLSEVMLQHLVEVLGLKAVPCPGTAHYRVEASNSAASKQAKVDAGSHGSARHEEVAAVLDRFQRR